MSKQFGALQQPPAPSGHLEKREPQWVTSMHVHYQRTGLYRAGDLDRVLGDPRKQVSGENSSEFAVACRVSHK
jgi:hypothetical protein